MINAAGEIPITYLNKGHAYPVSIVDTAPPISGPTPIQYRTSIRVSFEDGQGQGSAKRWRLWKEGRGATEAHQRGGQLQGVEYVEVGQPINNDSQGIRVRLETASLDGFSVLWSQGLEGSADCNIAVRFNFLSTDFSHSKGVKGILSRFCAKTEVVSIDSLHDSPEAPEICFCKVKLFRDHGAERKILNDVVHVKKSVVKLQQKIVETRDSEKRNRIGSATTKATRGSRCGKVVKHKRTSSISSGSITEKDLQFKLQTMQGMLTSTRPVSVVCVRGQEQDDPALYPILLIDEPLDLVKAEPEESTAWQQGTSGRSLSLAGTSTLISPSPSLDLPQSQGIVRSAYEASAMAMLPTHDQRSGIQAMTPVSSEQQQSDPQQLPSPPVEVHKPQQKSPGTSARWIETLELDSLSRHLSERPLKPGSFDIFMHSEKFY